MIELSTSQARLDLNSSSCVVEFASQVTSTRFQPQRFGFDDETGDVPASQGGLGLALTDSRCTTSVVIVNSLSGTVDPLVSTAISTGSEIQTTRIGIPPVAADSVREIELGENKLEGASRIDLGFGPSRASMLVLDGERVDGVSYYVLYRDALTKRPIAVSCL